MRAALSDDGTMVVLDGWTHVKPPFWPPLLPAARIRIISFVHLEKKDGAPWAQCVVQKDGSVQKRRLHQF